MDYGDVLRECVRTPEMGAAIGADGRLIARHDVTRQDDAARPRAHHSQSENVRGQTKLPRVMCEARDRLMCVSFTKARSLGRVCVGPTVEHTQIKQPRIDYLPVHLSAS